MEKKLMYVMAEPPKDVNKNTEWVTYPGVWTIYIFIVFFAWLLVLSLLGCSPGMAWTIVHLSHFFVSFFLSPLRNFRVFFFFGNFFHDLVRIIVFALFLDLYALELDFYCIFFCVAQLLEFCD